MKHDNEPLQNVLLGLISRHKLEKRMEKNGTFFKRTEKNGTYRTEKNVVPNPDISTLWNNKGKVSQH